VNQGGSANGANGGNGVGFWHAQRKDANNNYLYKNGSQVDTEADVSTAIPNGNITLLGVNNTGTPSSFTTRKMSMFSAGASLNTKENALYTAWNTYLTSI
jgi:hypothetical protein